MAEKSKTGLQQIPMYPKTLVYPYGESDSTEFQLEMIRARQQKYQCQPPQEEDNACDMDMTEACPTNITLNVPVVPSVERGKNVLQLMQKPDLKDGNVDCLDNVKTKEHAIKPKDKMDNKILDQREVPDHFKPTTVISTTQELHEKENLPPPETEKTLYHFTPSGSDDISVTSSYSWHGVASMITKLSFSEADSVSSLFQGGQLLDDRGGRGYSLQVKLDCEDKVLLTQEQQVFEAQFTNHYCDTQRLPSHHESESIDGSLATSANDPSSFSVYDEPSNASLNPLQNIVSSNASLNPPQNIVSSNASLNPSQNIVSRPVAQRKVLAVISQDQSKNASGIFNALSGHQSKGDIESFSVYDEPSINNASINPPLSRPAGQRKPLGIIPQDFSRDASGIVNVLSSNQSKNEVESFSVYDEPSINNASINPPLSRPAGQRKALGIIPQDFTRNTSGIVNVLSSNQSKNEVESFSVYDEPSINNASMNPPLSRPAGQRKALGIIPQDFTRNDTSSLSHYQSKGEVESFSVYDEPSIVSTNPPHNTTKPMVSRKPLAVVSQDQRVIPQDCSRNYSGINTNSRHQSKIGVESFNVFEEVSLLATAPSFSCHNVPQVESHKKEIKEPSPLSLINPSSSDNFKSPQESYVDQTLDPQFLCNDHTSTPSGKPVALGAPDITAIQLESTISFPDLQSTLYQLPLRDDPKTVKDFIPPQQWHLQKLDPIQEESRSTYTSSSSGSSANTCSKLSNFSRTSNISSASQHNDEEEAPELQVLRDCGAMNSKRQINPFVTETIEFMLQSLSVTTTPIHRSPSSCPRMTIGHTIPLAGSSYTVTTKIAKGGFATVYTVTGTDNQKKALKVGSTCGHVHNIKIQNPPFLWEVAITEELHKRLKANDLLYLTHCYMNIDNVQLYNNASIIIYDYYPYGTLLDLVNSCRTVGRKLTEPVLLYYVLELVQLIDALHNCGIIHADIKPDNIMLRDLRKILSNKSPTTIKGCGLCLLDFGRAIDIQAFPRGTQFIGSCDTDSFQCIQMLNNEPWTWQTDLHGIAGTVHVLLHFDYMELCKHPVSGLYQPKKPPSRMLDRPMWTNFFQTLLNWTGMGETQRPNLLEMAQPLSTKLSLSGKFSVSIKYLWNQLEQQRLNK